MPNHNFTEEEKRRGAEISRQKRRASKRERQQAIKVDYLDGNLRNVRALALKYGVSEKTIYRDLEEIKTELE